MLVWSCLEDGVVLWHRDGEIETKRPKHVSNVKWGIMTKRQSVGQSENDREFANASVFWST